MGITKELLEKEINNCKKALLEPNFSIDNYRCYFEGRQTLAEELLLLVKEDVSKEWENVIIS